MRIFFLKIPIVIIIIFHFGCTVSPLRNTHPESLNVNHLFAKIDDAVQAADRENKQVILYFWGAWCPFCEQLDKVLDAGELSTLLDDHYLLLRVDVEEFVQNMDVYQHFMEDSVQGIPALAVLKDDGTSKETITGKEWGNSDQEVFNYMKTFLSKNIGN